MHPLLKFFPLIKVDEAGHMVWGLVTSETPDSDNEICDYAAAKAQIKKWSDDALAKTTAAGQDPSLGNMRVMHQLQIGGKAIKIEYKDDTKQVWVGSEPVSEEVWHLLKGGFLTGHSIGGSYLWKRKDGEYTRYAPEIGEISYVDKPANPDAGFSYVKADGTTELRKFMAPGERERELLAKFQRDSDLDTLRKEFRADHDALMRQIERYAKGIAPMKYTAEQLKKAAEALGITVEELNSFVVEEALTKAKGLAALHEHLSAAHEHAGAMSKAHSAMGAMHDKMGSHIEKCMKACKGVMGSDGEADKAIKDLKAELVELAKAATGDDAAKKAAEAAAAKAAADAAANADKITKADADKLIADAVAKAQKEFEEGMAKLRVVGRASSEEIRKAQGQSGTADPFPV